eukprot:TRINITY_DN7547_c1_g1_i4.p4 TRINITY_DN7547_c1_g1~~TRINITY_DN7547_c1_g1_i4.p4  ORF type:complete len:102 (+),score=2.15 TRINITY_DN7547_c1_g1_i4:842-1147(+)
MQNFLRDFILINKYYQNLYCISTNLPPNKCQLLGHQIILPQSVQFPLRPTKSNHIITTGYSFHRSVFGYSSRACGQCWASTIMFAFLTSPTAASAAAIVPR